MDTASTLTAIDLCYAAVDDDRALDALASGLGEILGAVAGDVVTECLLEGQATAHSSFGFDPGFLRDYDADFLGANSWLNQLARLPRDQAHAVEQTVPSLRETRYFNDWVRPQGFENSLGAIIDYSPTQYTWIGFVREGGAPEFEHEPAFLTRLLPHLRRAFGLRGQLQTKDQENRQMRALFDSFGAPLFVVDGAGKVRFMNASAEQPGVALAPSRSGHLRSGAAATDVEISARILQTVGAARRPAPLRLAHAEGAVTHVHFAPLPQAEGKAPLVAVWLQVCTPSDQEADAQLMRALDLTPTEARIANWVAAGHSLAAFAQLSGQSIGTARWHLKNIQAKTGTSRIEEVASLARDTRSPFL